MRAYRELFGHRDMRWPIVASTFSRLTPGMMVLALVLLLVGRDYSYSAAGFVTAAHQLGVGVASPLQGRLADRFGQTRVLLPDGALYFAGTATLASLAGRDAPVAMLVLAALCSGVVYPPVTACARVLLSNRFPTGRLRETAFALSSIAVEIGFVLGPMAAAGFAAFLGGGWAVRVAGIVAFVGAGGYASTAAARGVAPRDRAAPRVGALASPGVRAMAVGLGCLAVLFGVVDIVVPAVAELAGHPNAAAWLLASLAGGSLLGGLVYGARLWPGTVSFRLRLLSAGFASTLLLLPLTLGSLVSFAAALFCAGLLLGPTTICAFQLIDDLALPGTQTEAQSWTQSAVVAGVALGASVAGLAVDTGGPTLAVLGGAGSVALAAAIFSIARRALARTVRGSQPSPTAVSSR